ncbi:MAG: chromate transporter [Oscillospiraceae bacterium]|nr:chromate transporter [Oscillospiraceae bacterium]
MNVLLDLFLTFAKIGAFTFGGGYAMISLIDKECVENKKWITSDELMEITVIAESTPGPIAINLATYAGYKMAGGMGAAAATLGMILPSFLIIWLISTFMENLLSIEAVAKAFKGIRIAVAVLIIKSALKIIKSMLKKTRNKYISVVIVSIFFGAVIIIDLLSVNFSTIYLIMIAGMFGVVVYGILLKEKNK